MNTKKMRLGIVGKDVSKSESPRVHAFILSQWGISCEYETISTTAEGFDGVARRLLGDFDGFNVTIPFKRDIMEYLDGIDEEGTLFGAVNTVTAGKGYNTDGIGFFMMLRSAGIEVADKKILVLGGGGSGRSTIVELKKLGAKVSVYQRNQDNLQELCAQLGVNAAKDPNEGGYDILINCTGVGMHDTVGCSPVRMEAFKGATHAIDLIYVPKKSEFLRQAECVGLSILNGASMLFYQAYYADCLYVGRKPSDSEAVDFYQKYLTV